MIASSITRHGTRVARSALHSPSLPVGAFSLRATTSSPRFSKVISTVPISDSDTVTNSSNPPQPPTQRTKLEHPVPEFNDARAAFASKTTPELLRAAVCFQLCQFPRLVQHSEQLLIASRKILGDRATDAILKATLYGHFCAGENQQAIGPVLQRLDQAGVGSILDYAAESDGEPNPAATNKSISSSLSSPPGFANPFHTQPPSNNIAREYDYEDEAKCDQHVQVFQQCIEDAASLSKDSFAAIKVTALGNPKLLARMSQAIVESKRLFQKFDANLDGYVTREEFENAYNLYFHLGDRSLTDIFEEFDPEGTGLVDYITWSLKLKPMDLPKIVGSCRESGPLHRATPTEEELELIDAMYQRGHVLGETATKAGTRLLVDAEQVRYQPAIDSLVLDLQQRFNEVGSSEIPIIYNTYQCYLKDAPERLRNDVNRAKRFNFHFGAKLVRGAYMESERELAKRQSIESPIHETMKDTHECYNNALDFLLHQSSRTEPDRHVEVMCASHNQESIEKAIEAMHKYQIDKTSNTMSFGQLYGMSDHLSFNLGRHGYRAYKYVPYGEVHEVIPYLLRRAQENSAIAGGASSELSMIRSEIRRRLTPFSFASQ